MSYSKYHNKKVVVDGITFDSIKESRRYSELMLLLFAKEISNLELQPEFELLEAFTDAEGKKHRGILYISDFSYMDRQTKRCIVEDVKPDGNFRTEIYKLKKKLFLSKYPHLILREV